MERERALWWQAEKFPSEQENHTPAFILDCPYLSHARANIHYTHYTNDAQILLLCISVHHSPWKYSRNTHTHSLHLHYLQWFQTEVETIWQGAKWSSPDSHLTGCWRSQGLCSNWTVVMRTARLLSISVGPVQSQRVLLFFFFLVTHKYVHLSSTFKYTIYANVYVLVSHTWTRWKKMVNLPEVDL